MPSTAQIIVKYAADVVGLVDGVRAIESSSTAAGKATKKVDWKNIAAACRRRGRTRCRCRLHQEVGGRDERSRQGDCGLQRTTGLDAETASAWIQTLKLRGIEVTTFQTSLVRLSTLMEKYRLAQEAATRATAAYQPEARPALADHPEGRRCRQGGGEGVRPDRKAAGQGGQRSANSGGALRGARRQARGRPQGQHRRHPAPARRWLRKDGKSGDQGGDGRAALRPQRPEASPAPLRRLEGN